MKSKLFILSFFSIVLLSSFGFVEYSILGPKYKIIQQDSTQTNQTKGIQNGQKLYDQETLKDSKQKDQDQAKSIKWSEYLLIGFKSVIYSMIKLLISF